MTTGRGEVEGDAEPEGEEVEVAVGDGVCPGAEVVGPDEGSDATGSDGAGTDGVGELGPDGSGSGTG